ncbi:MAG: glycosyltransferase family 4 protein [Solirubrobacteraceae bacterium]|nr:glycosyltransferase family 4 protein [Solirubrobacteraceae bacterium]
MRALIVSNMWPTPERPALGTFVVDQVQALRRTGQVDVDVATFPPGGMHYLAAIPALARRRGYDVVHAHFGLTALPALASGAALRGVTLHGTDLIAPKSRRVTLAVLPRYDVVGVPSEWARSLLPGAHAARARVLPCGIDLHTFVPIDRREARRALNLDPGAPFALFPYDPSRSVKRHDLALQAVGDAPLRTLGHEPRERMKLWLSAASIVICPADWETFGMAAVEAVACGTPVLATRTGVHPEVLDGLPWSTCEDFSTEAWRAAVRQALDADLQHEDGAQHAQPWSSDVMATRLLDAWHSGGGSRRQRQG